MEAADATVRADVLLAQAIPYLKDLLKSAPTFGQAGIVLVFHDGEITRVDVSATVQRKPRAGGRS
jgi:hypothetical protein